MVIAIWVLGVLLIAAIWCCIRFYDSIEQLERKLDASQKRAGDLAKEADYWLRQTNNYDQRYRRTLKGLATIQNMQTEGMANIGRRMVIAAAQAETEAKEIPFNKE